MSDSKKSYPTPTPALHTPEPIASRAVARPADSLSIIGFGAVVKGALASTGNIQIDGHIDGNVRSVGLIVSNSGKVYGEVLGGDVAIRGHVKGRIRARKLLLCAGCRVEGDILHDAIAIEMGAFFEGNCRHSANPLDDATNEMAEAGHAGGSGGSTVRADASHIALVPRLTEGKAV